ncbi:MAG: hypothetical protein ACREFB_16320 [Stellaceae bacterium]
MQSRIGRWTAGWTGGAAVLVIAAAAGAQAPPPPMGPEAAAIRECLCLQHSMDRAATVMNEKRRGLDALRDRLSRADAALDRARSTLNVNDPQAVAQFRQQLEQRDAMFRRTNGEIVADVTAAVDRYNHRVAIYNGQCANRPMDAILKNQIEATLSCPAE